MSVRQLAVVISILWCFTGPVVGAELVVSDAVGNPGETVTIPVS